MIYRILIDTMISSFDATTQTWHEYPSGHNLRGAFTAGLSEGLDDIPFPHVTNPRARFYFTEAGWQKYGRRMYAAARRRGHAIRIIRRKNPVQSQIVYQDAYQVADPSRQIIVQHLTKMPTAQRVHPAKTVAAAPLMTAPQQS